MKMIEARVRLFRSIVDSTPVPIQPDVTCLVGKNEAGKTAFLSALRSLNPAHPYRADVTLDYPRWRKVRDSRERDLDDVRYVRGTFELEPADLKRVSPKFPVQLPPSTRLVAERDYGGNLHFALEMDEKPWVSHLVGRVGLEGQVRSEALELPALSNLEDFVSAKYKDHPDKRTKEAKQLSALKKETKKARNMIGFSPSDEHQGLLARLLPKFFFFSDYSRLKGRIDLTSLLRRRGAADLKDSERTALSLLDLAGVEGSEFLEDQFEQRIAELEAAAGEITSQVFEYWTQNRDIRVDFQGDSRVEESPPNQRVVHRFLDIRLRDQRHHMTTNFETRSTGFRWFFSFIVAFSEFVEKGNLVVLLDEPGLGLHARAQADLLRYIDEQLAKGQVIYTAHSPFMVNPKRLERARLAEDLTTMEDPDRGSRISSDALSVQSDTLFPLQAALGYDIGQNLFVGHDNLVVEGPSDLVYLTTVSEYLKELGREYLDERWVQVPVGGIDKIPTFVALLGAHLDVTVLVDSRSTPNQRLQDLINQGVLKAERLVGVGQVTGAKDADIEDIFEAEEYVRLFNATFDEKISLKDLQGSDGIVKQIERALGSSFDHLLPATTFLLRKELPPKDLSTATLDRFELLFRHINETRSSR